MLELEGHASIRFLDEQEMASFFGRGDLISFYEDDVIVTVDTPEVCERSKVSGVYLVPLVHRYRPLGVAAFGFKPTPPSPPIAFLRAAQVVLTLELIVLKSEEITDVKLVFEDSIDEPSVIGLSTLGEAPPTEEYEE
jgi:hypothetical protein